MKVPFLYLIEAFLTTFLWCFRIN